MHGWSVAPGIALIAAGFVIQFGTFLRRPRPFVLVLTAIRLRFVGLGVLFLGVGLDMVISTLLAGFQIGSFVVGLALIGFAVLHFYAASDQIFRRRTDGT